MKIPVRNQKCHPELLRGHFQDTEKKEPKNYVFAPKLSSILPFEIFLPEYTENIELANVDKGIAISAKMEKKLHFIASKPSKTKILGLNGRFWHLK